MTFWLYFIYFWLCLIPFYVDSISINYIYVLLPFFLIFLKGKIQKPSNLIITLFVIFFFIFYLGVGLSFFEDYGLQARRISSYFIFTSIFFYSILLIEENIVDAFKKAVILISCYYCCISIFNFFYLGGNMIGYEQKDLVGSQRYGFVYLFALFLLIQDAAIYNKNLKNIGVILLVVGSFLTFSRATIVAMTITFILYLIFEKKKISSITKKNKFLLFFKIIFFTGCIAAIMFYLFPVLLDFFYERIIGRLFLKSDNYEIYDSENSEGFRLQVWESILRLVFKNPLTGSSYLGSYILKDVVVGSAHNQYFDILLRTGFLGFGAYLVLILKLLKFLFNKKRIFFWAFVSVLLYGFFHETFKETQGAFILTFIIGLYSNEKVNSLVKTLPIK